MLFMYLKRSFSFYSLLFFSLFLSLPFLPYKYVHMCMHIWVIFLCMSIPPSITQTSFLPFPVSLCFSLPHLLSLSLSLLFFVLSHSSFLPSSHSLLLPHFLSHSSLSFFLFLFLSVISLVPSWMTSMKAMAHLSRMIKEEKNKIRAQELCHSANTYSIKNILLSLDQITPVVKELQVNLIFFRTEIVLVCFILTNNILRFLLMNIR